MHVIRRTSGWAAIDFGELWRYRDLLVILIERDVRLRYRQTALGLAWVIIQPLFAAAIFAIIFGRFAKLPSDGVPPLLFNFAGLVGWSYFSGALQRASASLVSNSQLISKVYFPRLLIPLAHSLAVLVDFVVMFVMLLLMMACYRIWPTWKLATLPLFLLLGTLTSAGVSFWLSALSVKYRDFMYALPFLVQVWMYATPTFYAVSVIPRRWQALYALNPLVGFIEGLRWSTIGRSGLNAEMLGSAVAFSLALFVSGAFFFRRTERSFADVI